MYVDDVRTVRYLYVQTKPTVRYSIVLRVAYKGGAAFAVVNRVQYAFKYLLTYIYVQYIKCSACMRTKRSETRRDETRLVYR